ncbi:MAG: hypothetical protein E6850_09170 [Leclercia adecarboxylata]|nr:hypothetical protein [Leclercia adecarboxylata]HCN5209620.1 hypothetical protein [Escherichia coli]
MEKESQGFISISCPVERVKGFFVEGEIPQEGVSLELVVVKSSIAGDTCDLVIKFREVK